MKLYHLKVFIIAILVYPILLWGGAYEEESDGSYKYVIEDLNKIKYNSEFLKLNNSVQSVDTNYKVLSKEVDLLKNYFKSTLDNQKLIYSKKIESLTTQHKHELVQQEKRYESLLMQQVYIFSLVGLMFSSIIVAIGWFGFSNLKKMAKDRITKIVDEEYKATTRRLFTDFLTTEDNIKELKAGFDILEMKAMEEKSKEDDSNKKDEFDI